MPHRTQRTYPQTVNCDIPTRQARDIPVHTNCRVRRLTSIFHLYDLLREIWILLSANNILDLHFQLLKNQLNWIFLYAIWHCRKYVQNKNGLLYLQNKIKYFLLYSHKFSSIDINSTIKSILQGLHVCMKEPFTRMSTFGKSGLNATFVWKGKPEFQIEKYQALKVLFHTKQFSGLRQFNPSYYR